MGKRRRAPVEDGKEKIKKIQAAKAALGADHLAKDNLIKSPKSRKMKTFSYEVFDTLYENIHEIYYLHKNPRNKQQLHPPTLSSIVHEVSYIFD